MPVRCSMVFLALFKVEMFSGYNFLLKPGDGLRDAKHLNLKHNVSLIYPDFYCRLDSGVTRFVLSLYLSGICVKKI